jgi:hypothetical protein
VSERESVGGCQAHLSEPHPLHLPHTFRLNSRTFWFTNSFRIQPKRTVNHLQPVHFEKIASLSFVIHSPVITTPSRVRLSSLCHTLSSLQTWTLDHSRTMPIYYKKVSESESSHFLTDIASADDGCESDHVTSGQSTKLARTDRSSVSHESHSWRDSALDLNSIELQTPLVDGQFDADGDHVQRLETKHGPIWLCEQSDPSLPAGAPVLLTLHDLGLNHGTNFAHFFAQSEVRLLFRTFRVLHLTLPGQQDSAVRLPVRYHFPQMQQLSEVIDFALTYCKIGSYFRNFSRLLDSTLTFARN